MAAAAVVRVAMAAEADPLTRSTAPSGGGGGGGTVFSGGDGRLGVQLGLVALAGFAVVGKVGRRVTTATIRMSGGGGGAAGLAAVSYLLLP